MAQRARVLDLRAPTLRNLCVRAGIEDEIRIRTGTRTRSGQSESARGLVHARAHRVYRRSPGGSSLPRLPTENAVAAVVRRARRDGDSARQQFRMGAAWASAAGFGCRHRTELRISFGKSDGGCDRSGGRDRQHGVPRRSARRSVAFEQCRSVERERDERGLDAGA